MAVVAAEREGGNVMVSAGRAKVAVRLDSALSELRGSVGTCGPLDWIKIAESAVETGADRGTPATAGTGSTGGGRYGIRVLRNLLRLAVRIICWHTIGSACMRSADVAHHSSLSRPMGSKRYQPFTG